MNCKEAIPLMHDYLDGELKAAQMALLKEHLLACLACRKHFQQLERAGALLGAMPRVAAPDSLTDRIMQSLPAPPKRSAWKTWIRRHPAATAAAVFMAVMLSSFATMWSSDNELTVKGSDLDQVVIRGNTVYVPPGSTVKGNLIVENGKIQVDGNIEGNLVVIDGSYVLASTAKISGQVTKINQAFEWLWYKMNDFWSRLSR